MYPYYGLPLKGMDLCYVTCGLLHKGNSCQFSHEPLGSISVCSCTWQCWTSHFLVIICTFLIQFFSFECYKSLLKMINQTGPVVS